MFSIDPASTTPVYEQLIESVTRAISSGRLVTGDRIPPVRTVASDLGLAAGTVARAYKDMEAHGVIETRGRKGTFIAQSSDDRHAAARQAATAYLDRVMGQLHYSADDAAAILRETLTAR